MNTESMKIVSIGIQFDRFGEIDTMNEKYQADVKIVATWEDDQVIDKYIEGIHWNPELYVENLLTENRKTTKYMIERINEKNTTKIIQTQNIKGKNFK